MTKQLISAMLLISAAVATAQDRAPEGPIVETKTIILTGTQGSAGLWQQRLPAFPEGHLLTLTAEPMSDTFRSSRPKDTPRLKVRLGPAGSEEYEYRNQGIWVSHYSPMGNAITIPAVKDAALFTSLTAGAQFKLTVVVRKPTPAAAQPSAPPAPKPPSGGLGDLGGLGGLGGLGDLGGLGNPTPTPPAEPPADTPTPGAPPSGRVQGW